MIGSIISAILWFLVGAVVATVVILVFALFCVSCLKKDEFKKDEMVEFSNDFIDFSKNLVGDHSGWAHNEDD